MPYTVENPPEHIKGLPREAQVIWINAYNAASEQYKGDEEKANATAWSAVAKAGYAKGEDGKWAKAEGHKEEKPPEEKKPKEEHKEEPQGKDKKVEDEKPKPKEDFTDYEGVLAGVALLGADIPAVKTLSDVNALGEPGTLEDVEIFEAGYHKGKWYGLDYLERCVKLFDELKDKIKPPLKLGHGEQDLLKAEGLPAGGWVTSVKRVGRKLVASLSDVPEQVREAVRRGSYKRISAEFYPMLNLAEDKHESIWLFSEPDKRGGGNEMGVKTFTEEEVKLELEEKVEAETLKFREELAKLKKERSVTDRKLHDLEEKGLKDEVDKFVEDLRATGLAPAVIDGFGLGELYGGLKRTEPVKFSEEVEATQAECFQELMTEIVKRAKEGKLVLTEKELAAGKKHETFGEGEEDEDKRAKAWADEVNPEKAKSS